MAELGSFALTRKLSAAIATKWSTDATFIARGTRIFTPRLRHFADDRGVELLDLQIPSISFVERVSASPHYERRRAVVQVTAIVDAAQPIDPTETEPTGVLLDLLADLAEVVEAKLEIAVREIRSDATANPELAAQVQSFDFQEYETAVDTDGARLRAAGVFRYGLDLLVPHSFDTSLLDDLEEGFVDWKLVDDSVDPPVIFPADPHAQDEHTL